MKISISNLVLCRRFQGLNLDSVDEEFSIVIIILHLKFLIHAIYIYFCPFIVAMFVFPVLSSCVMILNSK